MFINEEIRPDSRPFIAVLAPGLEFILKYFDRHFDRRVSDNPAMADSGSTAFVVLPADGSQDNNDNVSTFCQQCSEKGLKVITLRVPLAIGTGMNGLAMRIARHVAKGSMFRIKENNAVWSVIHASDIPKAAQTIALNPLNGETSYTISPDPVPFNSLLDALAFRIKNKHLTSLSSKWARILYNKSFFTTLTSDNTVDASDFANAYPDFKFADPTIYLTTHVYDNDSL